MDIRAKLRKFRSDRQVTQEKMATILGVKQSAVSRIESGVQRLNLSHLEKLCNYYEVSIDFFLEKKRCGRRRS